MPIRQMLRECSVSSRSPGSSLSFECLIVGSSKRRLHAAEMGEGIAEIVPRPRELRLQTNGFLVENQALLERPTSRQHRGKRVPKHRFVRHAIDRALKRFDRRGRCAHVALDRTQIVVAERRVSTRGRCSGGTGSPAIPAGSFMFCAVRPRLISNSDRTDRACRRAHTSRPARLVAYGPSSRAPSRARDRPARSSRPLPLPSQRQLGAARDVAPIPRFYPRAGRKTVGFAPGERRADFLVQHPKLGECLIVSADACELFDAQCARQLQAMTTVPFLCEF